jgi:hypothetical protein
MAALTYTVCDEDLLHFGTYSALIYYVRDDIAVKNKNQVCSESLTRYGTYSLIIDNVTDLKGRKRIYCAVDDPLIDRTYLRPQDSYTGYSS